MELKIKYQYTYFIKPFIIEEGKYEKYLLNMLNTKKYKLKLFEKEKDLNLYSYFIPNVRNYFFPSFEFDNKKINELKTNNNDVNAKIISQFHCNIFEYILEEKTQGKIDKDDGIFFTIENIEIICFDSGICFLLLKTRMESSTNFSDLLNFNYKFKDIKADYNRLKEYNNIKIQTDKFENMLELSNFIDSIIEVNEETDLYNKRMFAFEYVCIDQENWNREEDFKNIENDFIKYTNLLSNNNTISFNSKDFKDNFQEIKGFKFAKFGFTKQSASLITSNVDINNYTKLLYDFEHEYLYTLIIALYQRIYLKKIEEKLNSKNNLESGIKNFYKYTNEIWYSEITNSLTGTMYYSKWKEIFESDKIYSNIKNKYEIIFKELKIEQNNKSNKIVSIALLVSLLLNIVNFIAIIKLM